MSMLKWTLIALAAAVALAAALVAAAYHRDMDRAYARIQGRSALVASPFGNIEYTDTPGRSGLAVLVIHGSGGGFDQGEFLARGTLADDLRWITPSRFGYLRSTFRAGATFDEQAHAYARLLDHLGLRRVAVVAFSHGGPSALLFAALHPDRVSSLTLLSAGVASSSDPAQQQANRQGDALMWIFQRDWRYWALTRAFPQRFLALMGATDEVIATLSPAQRRLAEELIEQMNPVSPRAAGTAFDNKAAMPNERVAAIAAPTLVLHARDDTLQRFHNAEFAARTIPGAQLVAFDRGGHLLLAVEQPAIRERVARHLRAHAGEP
jgi:pimeloyl-ACP methyl ester carboxylesterase